MFFSTENIRLLYIYLAQQVAPNINNSTSTIMQQLADKYDRFRQFIFKVVENNPNESIESLRTAPVTEFLASGQLMIETQRIATARDFATAVLAQTELTNVFDALPAADQQVILDYTDYFYAVISIIMH